MNAPLRRVGVVIMVLFGLLFANLNWVQALQGRRVPHQRLQRPGPGRRVRAPARQIIEAGGEPLAREQGHRRHAEVPAHLPGRSEPYAHVRRLQAGQPGRGRHRAAARTSSWPAPATSCSRDRVSDMFTGDRRRRRQRAC